jgi:hypothetical protein
MADSQLPALAALLQRAVGGAQTTTLEDRQAAEEQLRVWSEGDGFCRLLLTLASSQPEPNVDNSAVRVVAMIYLKNLSNRAWRARGVRVKALADQDKHWLRESLLRAITDEPVDAVAAQGILVAAKISRIDWPQNWPTLFGSITQHLDASFVAASINDSSQSLRVFRTLSLLSSVVKELASKPLQRDRRNVQDLASSIFAGVQAVWDTQAHQLVERITSFTQVQGQALDAFSAQQTIVLAESLLKTTKSAAVLLKHANSRYVTSENPVVQSFLTSSLSLLERASNTRSLASYPVPQMVGSVIRRPLREVVDKIVAKVAWMLKQVLDAHANTTAPLLMEVLRVASGIVSLPLTSFVAAMSSASSNGAHNSVDVSIYTNSPTTGGHASITGVSDKCVLWCIQILSSGLSSTSDQSNPQSQAASQFFSPNVITNLCGVVVCHYVGTQASDLTEWDDDPESFSAAEAATDRERNLGAAAHDLFLAAVDSHTELVCKWLAAILGQEERMHGAAVQVADSAPCGSCGKGNGTVSRSGAGNIVLCFACVTAGDAGAASAGSGDASRTEHGTLIVCHHVVMRDALYSCLGIAAYAMQDYISFTDLIVHSVLPLLTAGDDLTANNNNNDNNNSNTPQHQKWQRRILLRRSLWLVGCVISFVTGQDNAVQNEGNPSGMYGYNKSAII